MKEKKIEEETTGQNIMSASSTQGGHKKFGKDLACVSGDIL